MAGIMEFTLQRIPSGLRRAFWPAAYRGEGPQRVDSGRPSFALQTRAKGVHLSSFDTNVASDTGPSSVARKSSVEVKQLLWLVAVSSSQGYLATSEPAARMESDPRRSPWRQSCEGVGFFVVQFKVHA